MEIKEKEKYINKSFIPSLDDTTNIKNINSEKELNNSSTSDIIKLFIILLIIFLIIVLVIFIGFSIINSKSQKISTGIYIKDISVSNLTKEMAKDKVENLINSSIPKEIKLKYQNFEIPISTEQLSVNFKTDEAIDIAYNIGKKDNILKNGFNSLKTFFSNINIEPGFTIDEKQLKTSLENISSELPNKVIESGYYIDGNNLIITKGKNGYAVDIEATSNCLKNDIARLDLNEPIELIVEEETPSQINFDSIYSEIKKSPKDATFSKDTMEVTPSENGLDIAISLDEAKNLINECEDECSIPLKIVYPSITTNQISNDAFPDLLSEFSTKYYASNKNRTTNLILASNKINGSVIMPGEIFSYNKVVGERTIAAGYKEAPIYVNGRVEDGLGGGICQIATTLYNATLLANFEIVERRNHQFIPSYIGTGKDATVVYGVTDFKFKNNRNYPIKINCSVQNGIANFKILGLKTDDDYDVEINAQITSQTSSYIYSQTFKTLKKNGTIISKEIISKDTYKRH